MIDESAECVPRRAHLPAASEPAAAAFSWVFVASLAAHAALAARLIAHHPDAPHPSFVSQVEVEIARPPEPEPPPPPPPAEPEAPPPEPVAAATPPPTPRAAPARAPSVDPAPAVAAPGPPTEEGTFAPAAATGVPTNGSPTGTGTVAAPPPPPPPPAPAPVVPAREGANYRNNPRPPYPRHALKEGWEGKTLLKVKVLSDGRVGGAVIQQSAGHAILDEAAVAAVKAWTFAPAKQGDQPVEGWVTVPIDFHIQ